MASTVTLTMANPDHATASSCPSCGCDIPPPIPDKSSSTYTDLSTAQARIAELEAQVRQLNDKASTAINRWSEYETELSKLRNRQPSVANSPTSVPAQSPIAATSLTRISSLLYRGKSTPNLRPNAAKPPALRTDALSPDAANDDTPTTPVASMAEDLLEALKSEQTLRQEAEGRLTATSKEMEELSAALFEQANEMVADERKARAKLEERVGELERRDFEKRQRLERLETAMERIDRVKNLLKDGGS